MTKRLFAILVLTFALCVPAWATITPIVCAAASASSASAAATTASTDMTGATFFYLAITYANGATQPTPSDSASNTWGSVLQTKVGTSETTVVYAVNSATAASNQTFTASAQTNGYTGILVCGFSGVNSATIDQSNSSSSGSSQTSFAGGSVTPSENNEVVLTAIVWSADPGGTPAVSGYAAATSAIGSAISNQSVTYVVQTTAAATNPTWTWTNMVRPTIVVSTFKAAGAAPSNQNGLGLLNVGD